MTYEHRLNSLRGQVRIWIEHATSEDRAEFLAALEAVCDRSPEAMAPFSPRELSGGGNRIAMQLQNGVVLVWADLLDVPSFFNVIYVGHLES